MPTALRTVFPRNSEPLGDHIDRRILCPAKPARPRQSATFTSPDLQEGVTSGVAKGSVRTRRRQRHRSPVRLRNQVDELPPQEVRCTRTNILLRQAERRALWFVEGRSDGHWTKYDFARAYRAVCRAALWSITWSYPEARHQGVQRAALSWKTRTSPVAART
jgi:hypothetical protein